MAQPDREAGSDAAEHAQTVGSVQIGLHWTIAALVLLVQVPAGITMTSAGRGAVQKVGGNVHSATASLSSWTVEPEWPIGVGACTHLGCMPLGPEEGDSAGRNGGWFCPCPASP